MYTGEHEVNPADEEPFDWENADLDAKKAQGQLRADDPNDQGDIFHEVHNPEVESPPDLGELSRRNPHCSNCGDLRGGPFGHETSECTYG